MMNSNLKRDLRKQAGMSLVEVMVAMTIGLIILIALGYFFLGSVRSSRSTDDVSRMQESGRNALELMGRAIRQAGYRTDKEVFELTSFTGNPIAGTASTITLQYNAQAGGELNCDGTSETGLVTAAFEVSGGALTCSKTASATGVASGTKTVMVDNIESMQIMYGIDTGDTSGNRDGSIDSYTATPSDFKQVAAVRIMLTVKGPTLNAAVGGDGYLRQTYNSTFTVRNQAW